MAAVCETKGHIFQLFWIFIIGCVLGDIIETIYCFVVTGGTVMNRSSVLYGPFSIVWGAGAVLITVFAIILNRIRFDTRSVRGRIIIFITGGIIGDIHEYVASCVTELLTGAVHWNYSDMAYNISGRTNLLFCFFWGIAALIWVRCLYPYISGFIAAFPWKIAKTATLIAAVFMIIDIYISTCSLIRFTERSKNIPAISRYERFLDEAYPDSLITYIYPDIQIVD